MLIQFWHWLQSKFHDDRRGLFSFFDGRRYRKVDALTAARALFSHPTYDWDETPGLLQSGIATVQLTAFARIGEAMREVFSIPDMEAGGLTELGCADLLASFQDHLGHVKKNGSLFPISPISTAQGSLVEMPMPPPLDLVSGSIGNDPSPANAGLPAGPTSENFVRSQAGP